MRYSFSDWTCIQLPACAAPSLTYDNERTEAAEDQTPENGGLVACGPVDVLAGSCPEGDGRHCSCVCEGVVERRKVLGGCNATAAVVAIGMPGLGVADLTVDA